MDILFLSFLFISSASLILLFLLIFRRKIALFHYKSSWFLSKLKGNIIPQVAQILLLFFANFVIRNESPIKFSRNKKYVLDDVSFSITKSCPLCNFVPSNEGFIPNSNDRDLILTVAFNKLQNVFCFVRSARTTGFKGRIVIITNDLAISKKTKSYFSTIKKCGVQFISVGNYTPTSPVDLYYYRYEIYHQLLQDNKDILSRVILCDLYDTFFQHDPFTTNFSSDWIIFSGEGTDNNGFNRRVSKECFQQMHNIDPRLTMTKEDLIFALTKGPPINGGLIAGGISPMLTFTKYMTNIGNPFTLKGYSDDQGCLNFFVKGHVFDKVLQYHIDGSREGFLASWSTFARRRPDIFTHQNMGEFHINNSKIPAILHQFDRSHVLVNKLISSCPDIDPLFNDSPKFKYCRSTKLIE